MKLHADLFDAMRVTELRFSDVARHKEGTCKNGSIQY